MTCDMRYVTHDIGHFTHRGGEHCLKMSGP